MSTTSPRRRNCLPWTRQRRTPPPRTRAAVTTRHRTPRPKKSRRPCRHCWKPAHPPWPRPDQGSMPLPARSGWWPPPGWPRWPGWPTGCTAEPKNTPAGDRDGGGSSAPQGSGPAGQAAPVVRGCCRAAPGAAVLVCPEGDTAPPGQVDSVLAPCPAPGNVQLEVLLGRQAPPVRGALPVEVCSAPARLVDAPSERAPACLTALQPAEVCWVVEPVADRPAPPQVPAFEDLQV